MHYHRISKLYSISAQIRSRTKKISLRQIIIFMNILRANRISGELLSCSKPAPIVSPIQRTPYIFAACLLNSWYKHKILTNRQNGFTKNSNTECPITDFLLKTCRALDTSLKCVAIFL